MRPIDFVPPWLQPRVLQKEARERSFVSILTLVYDLYTEYARDPVGICFLTWDVVFPNVTLFNQVYFFVLSFRPHECYRHFTFALWMDDAYEFNEKTPEKLGLSMGDLAEFDAKAPGPQLKFKINQWPLEKLLNGISRAGSFMKKNRSRAYSVIFDRTVRPFLDQTTGKRHTLEVFVDITFGRHVPRDRAEAFIGRRMPVMQRDTLAEFLADIKYKRKAAPRRRSKFFSHVITNGSSRKFLPWSHRERRQFFGRLLGLRSAVLLHPGPEELVGRQAQGCD